MNRSSILGFVVGPVGAALMGLISIPVIAWFYTAEDIGRVAMLQVAISFSILFFSLGLDQAYVREYHESSNKSALLKAVFQPGLILLSVAFFLLLFASDWLSFLLYGISNAWLGLLTLVCIMAGFIARFLSLILRMEERGLAFSFSQLLPKLLYIVAILMFVLISTKPGFAELLLANVISMLAVAVFLVWSTRKSWISTGAEIIEPERQRAMLRFGVPLIFSGLAFWGLTAADKLFLRNYSSLFELGVYSLAASFAGAAVIIQSIFSVVWAPTVYKWVAAGENLEKVDRVTEYTLSVVVFTFILAGLLSWLINCFLPGDYEAVQYIFLGCMAYPLFYTLSETTVVGLGVAKRSGLAMTAALIALLVNVVANYCLVGEFGAAGASVATAISFWVFLVCRTEFSCYVWRPLPRMRLYISTFFMLVLVASYALVGSDFKEIFRGIWILALLVATYTFRSSIVDAIKFSRSMLSGRQS